MRLLSNTCTTFQSFQTKKSSQKHLLTASSLADSNNTVGASKKSQSSANKSALLMFINLSEISIWTLINRFDRQIELNVYTVNQVNCGL